MTRNFLRIGSLLFAISLSLACHHRESERVISLQGKNEISSELGIDLFILTSVDGWT
ncbi:putative lipoprotein [Leptospira wolffii serovar Khorat str. Khorat-H2]|nr:putative lipoprotein [Leptospira wolffii serovar Khorat str. Khorat-H2]